MPNAQARKRSREDVSPQRRHYGFTDAEISELTAADGGAAWTKWRNEMIKYGQASSRGGGRGVDPVKESDNTWREELVQYARAQEEVRSKRAEEKWSEDERQMASDEATAWKEFDEREKVKELAIATEDVEMEDVDDHEAQARESQEPHAATAASMVDIGGQAGEDTEGQNREEEARNQEGESLAREENAENQTVEDQSATEGQARQERQAGERRARLLMVKEKLKARAREARSDSVQPTQLAAQQQNHPLAGRNLETAPGEYALNEGPRNDTRNRAPVSALQVQPPLTLEIIPIPEQQAPTLGIQEGSHGQDDQGQLAKPLPPMEQNTLSSTTTRQQDEGVQVRPEKQARSRAENQDQSHVAGTKAKPKEKATSHVLSEKQKGKQPQKMKAVRGDTEVPIAEDSTSLFIPESGPPDWYINATFGKNETKKLVGSQPVKAIGALKDCLRRCLKEQTAKVFDELRDHVHKAEFLQMTIFALKKTFIFDTPSTPPENRMGLRRIFEDPIFPWDLQEDARQLYLRWWYQKLEPDLLRGIRKSKISQKEGWRNNDSIDPGWNKPSAKYYGQGDLVMGQWWPTQLCTVRDGAHGSAQGGIYGEKECGAYSIVLSGGAGYEDEDHGDWILYSGTDGKDMVASEATTRLIESCDNVKAPVRVIRSMNLKKPNKYRPEVGYRYDGLYEVVSYELRNKMKAAYRFRLERCPGQNPIRFEGKEARPTYWEKEEYVKLKLNAKFAGM